MFSTMANSRTFWSSASRTMTGTSLRPISGRAPTPFACDYLKLVGGGAADDDWLDDSFALDRLSEFQQRLFIEFLARLIGFGGADLSDRGQNHVAVRLRQWALQQAVG